MDLTGPAASTAVDTDDLDRFLDPDVRIRLEDRYWRPIEQATHAEAFLTDEAFFADPGAHPATFSDHGVVHVRDVARRAARLAEQLDGGLLPSRSVERRRLVQGSAVLMAYLHDIGMVAATPVGRRVHAQFAAHTALGAGFDDVAEDLWASDAGGLRTRIEGDIVDAAAVPGDVVIREVLALSLCHSKTAVPAAMLDDPAALRRVMLRGTFTALDEQMLEPKEALRTAALDRPLDSPAAVRYGDAAAEAFAWLLDARLPARCFVADVVDGIRVLRAADALRQRGTTQRTSAGYEICVDRHSGRAVMAVRSIDDRFGTLMWVDSRHSVAESNLRVVDLTSDGSLRIAYHCGDFGADGAAQRIAVATAETIADVEADALGSFRPTPGGRRSARQIEVVPPPDDPGFAKLVVEALERNHPHLAGRTVLVEEPHPAPAVEVADWYRRGRPVTATEPDLDGWFEEFARHGLNVEAIDRHAAVRDARVVRLGPGDVVFSPGTAASIVMIPLGPGARVEPIGGYRSEPLRPWLPVGVTGVVRGAERNASVIAEADVDVLAIPAERYLTDWFQPYEPAQLRIEWQRWLADGSNSRARRNPR